MCCAKWEDWVAWGVVGAWIHVRGIDRWPAQISINLFLGKHDVINTTVAICILSSEKSLTGFQERKSLFNLERKGLIFLFGHPRNANVFLHACALS